MPVFEDFISKLGNATLVEVSTFLRSEIMKFEHLSIKKRYNLPFFYGKTWICYLNLIKHTEIELCFVRGRELQSKELLNFKNRTMIGGLGYKKTSDIDLGVLKLLLEEAIELDESKPYTFVKRKKK